MRPVDRRSLSDGVFEALRDEIVGGRIEAGSELPPERQLAERMDVSRAALREAIARLAHAGLIAVRHGGKTRVNDFRREAGLDLLPHMMAEGGLRDPDVLQSALEMRAALAPDVARKCAERDPGRGPTLLLLAQQIRAVVKNAEQDGGLTGQDLVELRRLNAKFWNELVEGSGNVAYQLAYNSLRRAVDPVEASVAEVLAHEFADVGGFLLIAAAVQEGDSDVAARAAAKHIPGAPMPAPHPDDMEPRHEDH